MKPSMPTTTSPSPLKAKTMDIRPHLPSLTLLCLGVLAACSSSPLQNAQLDEARASLRVAQSDPAIAGLSGLELRQAQEALATAEAALAAREDTPTVDHLAYLAQQRIHLLHHAGSRRGAELAVAQANSERDQLRLQARTQEANTAQRQAAASQRDAQSSQRDAQVAQRDAQQAQRSAETSQRDAQSAQLDAQAAQQQAAQAERVAASLTAQLRELQATQTNRGMVVTLGDVLFDNNQAQLKSGSLRSLDKLVVFLQTYPQRKALIEGFTDSVGADEANRQLSARRADAVRHALVSMGVAADRLSAMGFGEAHPVAGNDSASGRQMNRRVEILLSDDRGVIVPR